MGAGARFLILLSLKQNDVPCDVGDSHEVVLRKVG